MDGLIRIFEAKKKINWATNRGVLCVNKFSFWCRLLAAACRFGDGGVPKLTLYVPSNCVGRTVVHKDDKKRKEKIVPRFSHENCGLVWGHWVTGGSLASGHIEELLVDERVFTQQTSHFGPETQIITCPSLLFLSFCDSRASNNAGLFGHCGFIWAEKEAGG